MGTHMLTGKKAVSLLLVVDDVMLTENTGCDKKQLLTPNWGAKWKPLTDCFFLLNRGFSFLAPGARGNRL